MTYILKRSNIENKIVGRLNENTLEYDDEILGRIVEEVWGQDINRSEGNKKFKIKEKKEIIKSRLYSPYFVSENEFPEFEIYKFKKELK